MSTKSDNFVPILIVSLWTTPYVNFKILANYILLFLKGIPEPPIIPKTLFHRMWLDTKLETITRLQTKPGIS